jgi:MFS family permease
MPAYCRRGPSAVRKLEIQEDSLLVKSRTATVVYVSLLWALNLGILALVLPLHMTSIGRSASQWGVLSAAFFLAMVFAEPIWGWISDRIGIVVPLLISRLASAALIPVFALTADMGVLTIVQALRGVAEIVMPPLARTALSQSLGSDRKAMGMGVFQSCQFAGMGLGSLLAGYLVGRWSHGQVLALSSALSMAGFLATAAGRSQLSLSEVPDSTTTCWAPSLERAARMADRKAFCERFAILAFIGVSLYTGVGATRSFLPLLGTSVAGLPPSQVALLLALVSTVGGLLMIVIGRLSDQCGRKPFVAAGLLVVSISFAAYAYSHTLGGMFLSTLLYSVGSACAIPAVVAWVSDVAPSSRQGQVIGLYGSFEDIGLMVGALLCGFVWDAYGPRLALLAIALASVPGILASVFAREGRQRPIAERVEGRIRE